MRYCIKTILVLPSTVEETKKILAEYHKDLLWDDDEIDEILGDIKTWKDVENFLDTFDASELYDLGPYFDTEYGSELIEKE